MNVLDSTILLYEWFQENDSFCMEEDFIKIKNVTDEPERDRASFLCALNSLEKYEVVQTSKAKWKEEKEKRYWILNKPIASLPQSIELDSVLAGAIAATINTFSKNIGRPDIYCDPLNVSVDNIRDLCFMAGIMNDSEEKKDVDN